MAIWSFRGAHYPTVLGQHDNGVAVSEKVAQVLPGLQQESLDMVWHWMIRYIRVSQAAEARSTGLEARAAFEWPVYATVGRVLGRWVSPNFCHSSTSAMLVLVVGWTMMENC